MATELGVPRLAADTDHLAAKGARLLTPRGIEQWGAG
jgi:hypothetical protein